MRQNRIRKVLIVGDSRKEGVLDGKKQLTRLLRRARITVYEEMHDAVPLVDWDVDLVVVLGGDGSVLSAIRRLADERLPVMGVNFGHLGFLAARRGSEIRETARDIIGGNFQISRRTRLQVAMNGRLLPYMDAPLYALNDVVIERATGRTCWVTLKEPDGEQTVFGGDGVIVATSTGTTAYNRSAGGPMIDPATTNIVVTPICPIDIAANPIISSGRRKFVLEIHERSAPVRLVVDGRELGVKLGVGDVVTVSRARRPGLLALPLGWSYTRVLKERLGWNVGRQ